MKLIAALIFSLLLITAHSQTVITNSYLNKFIGTWRWTSGTDTVEIVLQKQVYNIPMTSSNTEDLVGWHRYVKNGTLIQSSFPYIGRDINIYFNSNNLDFKTTLHGFTYSNDSSKIYFIRFWDLTLHKNFELFMSIPSGSTNQANWELKQPRGIYNGPSGLNGVFTLPKQLVLTKI